MSDTTTPETPRTYVITLANCAFFARHGVLAEETRLGQRFFVDCELEVEAGTALTDDRIEGTVHYGLVFEAIEAVVTGTRRNLIETLAHDVARRLLSDFQQVRRARITLRKPSVPIAGILDHAQVTVELVR
ncbi:dihydroneopterin aldolase [Xaviernesmea oryzae]|uniref:7,8-dihydroneopterin aldolase n=1 Tax=Xaviernesmea oryzae TaxID=464029 RepID=A0A1Q9B093_9HYPH|nr:dihydroneopterin aldolase [Xaviernesmea oryzae]OLP61395.1 dihydroneopterin aldolase [Xaviernesmea oryzae]SEL70880.1 dihydroneopterin aldolase [Xaviernesmea oryzae]